MRETNVKRRINAAALAATLFAGMTAAPAWGQLASPSPAALGMGDNYTAAARGYAAPAWNPAGLAMRGNPGWSLSLAAPRAIAGLGPVTMSELARWEDAVVPTDVRQRWLADIQTAGGQSGTGGFDATWIALQVGPVAIQGSTSGRAVSDISPGLAQLIMLGNVDSFGVAQDIVLAGSSLTMNALSTVGASFAHPFALPGGASRLSVGVTAKYTVGHFLAVGDQSLGQATASPLALELSFPLLHSPTDEGRTANGGSGVGLDVGVGWEAGDLTLAAAVHNVVNTFAWDADVLRYRPAAMSFSVAEQFATEFDERPLGEAPAAIRELVDDMGFRPSVTAGAMLRYSPALMLTADARFSSAAALATRATSHLGAGAEYRLTDFLPVRAGAAWVRDGEDNAGVQFGAGLGISLGAYSLSASYARRAMELGSEDVFMFSVLSFGL